MAVTAALADLQPEVDRPGIRLEQAIATAHDAAITAYPIPDGGLPVSVIFPQPASPTATADHRSQSDGHGLEIELAMS